MLEAAIKNNMNRKETIKIIIIVVIRIRSCPYPGLVTGFVTRITRRVLLVKQELLILPEQLSSSWVLVGFSEVRVPQYLVFCVDHCHFDLFLLGITLSVFHR